MVASHACSAGMGSAYMQLATTDRAFAVDSISKVLDTLHIGLRVSCCDSSQVLHVLSLHQSELPNLRAMTSTGELGTLQLSCSLSLD